MKAKDWLSLAVGVALSSQALAQPGTGNGVTSPPGGAATGMTSAPIAGPRVVNPQQNQNPGLTPNPGTIPSPGPIAPNSAPAPVDPTTRNNTSLGFRSTPNTAQTTVDARTIISAQQALAAKGFPLAADGVVGTNTQNAIRQFQASNGLDQSGVFDAPTLNALGITPQTQ